MTDAKPDSPEALVASAQAAYAAQDMTAAIAAGDAAVAQASYGTYNKFEIERGLERSKLTKYFSSAGANWKIKDELRAMASFISDRISSIDSKPDLEANSSSSSGSTRRRMPLTVIST